MFRYKTKIICKRTQALQTRRLCSGKMNQKQKLLTNLDKRKLGLWIATLKIAEKSGSPYYLRLNLREFKPWRDCASWNIYYLDLI
jgi:hypothetical protein